VESPRTTRTTSNTSTSPSLGTIRVIRTLLTNCTFHHTVIPVKSSIASCTHKTRPFIPHIASTLHGILGRSGSTRLQSSSLYITHTTGQTIRNVVASYLQRISTTCTCNAKSAPSNHVVTSYLAQLASTTGIHTNPSRKCTTQTINTRLHPTHRSVFPSLTRHTH